MTHYSDNTPMELSEGKITKKTAIAYFVLQIIVLCMSI